MTNVFFDTEFTGLHKNTSLISIGLISECGKEFYAEFNDYDRAQIDLWLRDNVIQNLLYNGRDSFTQGDTLNKFIKSDTNEIKKALEEWFSQFEAVKMVSDCLAYDWVLFHSIFGTAFDIPKNVYYIPFELCTLLEQKGIDPDINREVFAHGFLANENKHNALWDAKVIKMCFDKAKSL